MRKLKDISGSLDQKLSSSRVKKHPHSGFDYIESWDAIDCANKIFGYMGWESRIDDMRVICEEKNDRGTYEVGYMATVTVTVSYIDEDGKRAESRRQGSGVGVGHKKKLSDAHEGAVKSAESDARKRALMQFGAQFGLALYDEERLNVDEYAVGVIVSGDDSSPNTELDELTSLSNMLSAFAKKSYTVEDFYKLAAEDSFKSRAQALSQDNPNDYDVFIDRYRKHLSTIKENVEKAVSGGI